MRLGRRTTVLASALAASALTLTLAGPAVADGALPHPSSPSDLSSSSSDAHRDDTVSYAPRSTPAAAPLADSLLRSIAPGGLSAATASTTVHQLDMVVVTPKGKTRAVTDADVRTLVSDVSAYWSAQTRGRVTFSVKGSIKYLEAAATCNTSPTADNTPAITKLWTQGSKAVSGKDWWAGGKPTTGPAEREHLVVLYPYGTPSTDHPYGENACGGTLGLGTTPTKASVNNNGLTFALFGSTDATVEHTGAQYYTAGQSLAHELGHNFGLQHASTWWCTGAHNDATWLSPACTMLNYADPYDVMGGGYGDQGIPALSGPQKLRLGLLASSQHRTVTDTTPAALTLQPVPASETSAPSGLQAVQVKDPSTGETYTVEYRPTLPGVSFPMGSPLDTPYPPFSDVPWTYTFGGAGVRILRLAPSNVYYSDDNSLAWSKNEQSIVSYGPTTAHTSYVPVGKTFTTRSGKVSITVGSADGSQATVSFVVHRKARLSLSRSATSQRYRQTAVKVTARTGVTNGAAATGTVTFKDGSKTLKTVTTSSTGVASYLLPKTLSVKTHSITATFTPNAATKARFVEPITVGTKVKVTKAASAASVKLAHTTVRKGAKPKVTVKVSVKGITGPTGTVRLYENGHKVKTVTLSASRKGTLVVTLPKTTKRGTVKIVAKYSGSSTILAKTSNTAKLRVS